MPLYTSLFDYVQQEVTNVLRSSPATRGGAVDALGLCSSMISSVEPGVRLKNKVILFIRLIF